MNNYFNYFTEIEEYFIRKRSKNLLISPLDWCLIELWKNQGIPLHVVLRGVDRSFEAGQKMRKKTPRSLFYCHPAVMEAYEEYTQVMVGASRCAETQQQEADASRGPSREELVGYLGDLEGAIRRHRGEIFVRAADRIAGLKEETFSGSEIHPERLDRDLSEIGAMLAESLKQAIGAEKLEAIEGEVKKEMKIYRRRLSREIYEKLKQSYLERKILSLYDLPEFTLLAIREG